MIDDLRFALRRLLSAPGFTGAAVMTLALGIGANTAIFSVADAVLFRPLPYTDPDTLHVMQMRELESGVRAGLVEYRFLEAIDEHHGGLSAVGVLELGDRLVHVDPDGATYIPVTGVTPNYFDLLGATAARGRLLTASDGASVGRAAVLTHALWQTRFGGRDDIVGRPLAIGTATFDVVGILPRGFVFPTNQVPPSSVITILPPLSTMTAGGTIHPIVRRATGVGREQAQAEIDALTQPLAGSRNGRRYLPYLEEVRSVLYPTGRPIMTFLFAAAGLVLLLGCANLANMLLARARRGMRETGIRVALGASRGRLVRELLCESVLLGSAGAALALSVTYLSFDLLLQQVPPIAYGRAPVGVDLRVFSFGAVLGLAAAVVVSAIPAWRMTRLDAQHLTAERTGARGSSFGRPMVAAQVAVAVLLVFGAAVAARALISVLAIPLGFSPENVVVIGVAPGVRGTALQDFHMRAIETLSRRGDVIAAGAATSLPLSRLVPDQAIGIDGVRQNSAAIYHVLPGYFESLAIPLLRGRLPAAADARNRTAVAVLSDGAARVLFAGRDPLGASVATPSGGSFTVIGIVGDIRRSLGADPIHPVYVLPHEGTRFLSIIVRTRGAGASTLADLKREVAAMSPGTPVGVGRWTDAIAGLTAYRNPRFQTLVLGSFAGLALVLTATGILGVVSFLIAARSREMGIRIAVGATPSSLVILMLRQTLMPIAIGLTVGLVATRWAGRLAEAQLFVVDVHDPAILCAAALTVLVTAALAAYLPARRAGRVDPIAVLRVE